MRSIGLPSDMHQRIGQSVPVTDQLYVTNIESRATDSVGFRRSWVRNVTRSLVIRVGVFVTSLSFQSRLGTVIQSASDRCLQRPFQVNNSYYYYYHHRQHYYLFTYSMEQ
jgi:hypothetical protein